MIERKISEEFVEKTINEPVAIMEGHRKRKIFQKLFGNKLIRVITEENNLLTVYCTNKSGKYMKGDKE